MVSFASLSCIEQTLWNLCEQKHLLKNDKRCRDAYGLKKNENKGDVELTLSPKKTAV